LVSGEVEFRYPTHLVSAGDEIVVLDSGNYRIQILELRGHFRNEIGFAEASNHASLAMGND